MPALKLRRCAAVFALAGFGFLMAQPTHAGDSEGRYAAKGPGLMPCSTFLSQLQSQGEGATLAMVWFSGYLSAANAFIDDTYDLVSWQSDGMLANLLAGRCSQSPDRPLVSAANEVVQLIGSGRITSAEQPERVKVGELERLIYPSVVRQIQQALKDNGQSLTVDGDFGPGTQRAIRSFQENKGLETTGFPDALTLIALFTGQVPQQQ